MVYTLKPGEYDLPPDPNVYVTCLEDSSFGDIVKAHLYLFKVSIKRYLKVLLNYILIPFIKKTCSLNSDREKRGRTVKKTRRYLKAAVIAADLHQKQITHLHAHYAHRPAETAMRAALWTGISFSFTAHAKDLFLTNKSKVYSLVKKAEFVLTCTRDGKNYLRNICKPKYHDKIECIYHGLPLEKYGCDPNKKYDGSPIILSAGRFIDKKGFDVLLESLFILKRKGIKFKCIIAGDGRLDKEIKSLSIKLGLEQDINFPGFLSENEMIKLYRKGCVFVLSSRESADGNKDGIPNVILEAMAFGLPVVSTSVGGIPEVVRNHWNGLLINPNDSIELADAIEIILRNNKLREEMGSRGRKTVNQKFDIQKNGKVLFDHFINRSNGLKMKFDQKIDKTERIEKFQTLNQSEYVKR